MVVQDEINIQGNSINQKPYIRIPVMLCTGATFVKKNSCLIQCFQLGIFSFNQYVYYLTRGFIASTRAFNLLTRAFNLAFRAFSFLTAEFELVTRRFEFVTRRFELGTHGLKLVTHNS